MVETGSLSTSLNILIAKPFRGPLCKGADKFKQYKTVEIVNMDYNKSETITDALQNVDGLFWLTLPAPKMTQISSNLLKRAKKSHVGHIVNCL